MRKKGGCKAKQIKLEVKGLNIEEKGCFGKWEDIKEEFKREGKGLNSYEKRRMS